MRGFFLAAAMTLAFLSYGSAQAAEGKEIDCKKTNLDFSAAGFEARCKDYSDNSVSVGELNAGARVFGMFALSEADTTFIQAYSKAILGGTRIYFQRRSIEAELGDSFPAQFSDWGDEEDIGDFKVKHMTLTSNSGEPSDCIGFLKPGPRRHTGVSGLTAGYACSGDGRAKALEVVKEFANQQP